jgi:hypothetical protein
LISSPDWKKDPVFKSIGGYSTSDPAAVIIRENDARTRQIMVLYRGLDRALWSCTCEIQSNSDSWSPWSLLPDNSSDETTQLSENKNDGWYRLLNQDSDWVGAFPWHLGNTVYCFWKQWVLYDKDAGHNTIFGLPMTADRVWSTDGFNYPDRFEFTERLDQQTRKIFKLAPHCGGHLSNEYLKLVGAQQASASNSIDAIAVGGPFPAPSLTGKLGYKVAIQLTPTFEGPFNLYPPYSAKTFSDRKKIVSKAFKQNKSASAQAKAYLEEAFYSVPMLIGLSLKYHQQYQGALDWFRSVYNYVAPIEDRKIFYGLKQEEILPLGYDRPEDWLADPLNPHHLARQRINSYTKFTLFCIIQCLLDYADAEFTADTAETIPRARVMYLTVLDLLDAPEISKKLTRCPDVVGTLTIDVEEPGLQKAWQRISKEIIKIGIPDGIENLVDRIQKEVLSREKEPYNQISQASKIVHEKKSIRSTRRRLLSEKLQTGKSGLELINKLQAELMTDDSVADSLKKTGETITAKGYSPEPKFLFCIPSNPVTDYYLAHAEINLKKLRTCRNIAGMQREVDPYASATDTVTGLPQIGAGGQIVLPGVIAVKPTQYRYRALIERTKQLINIAQQVEASFLSTLERRDAELYSQLRAKQDARLVLSKLGLHDLKVTEATHGVRLAVLQKERAWLQQNHYHQLIKEGWLGTESAAVIVTFIAAGLQVINLGIGGGSPQNLDIGGAIKSLIQNTSSAAQAVAAGLSMIASFERRLQEWKFQERLATKDVVIGEQQILLAQDKQNIVNKEREIAKLESDNANDVVEFLRNKFTSAELFEWMSGVLENVYRFFLQQATSMAKLAENQLAFERQETPVALIQSDYWIAPENGGANLSSDEKSSDRRGLTGSARLLKDIYQLDQHAFETDRRKLQLSKTLSIARLDPLAFHRFRETGTIIFDTPMAMFDRDFPGHYLRLVKRVRTSVLALIPSIEGIKATLTSLGISRVVIGGDVFQEVVVQRDPESVALTSPLNATGLFELQEDPDKLFPFEAMGVDTRWEFSLPKASNPFDFRTIFDVLLTIEYTALNSYDYRQQVIERLDRNVSADRPYSLRQQFPDQWYTLHNPRSSSDRVTVTFSTRREDYPPNIDTIEIQHTTLYFATKTGEPFTTEITLHLKAINNAALVGGAATPVENIISTRRGNAGSWTALIGAAPVGTWELSLPNTEEVRNRFKSGDIEDILLVITFQGQTPPWPQ